MNLTKAIAGFVVLSVLYLGALTWVDARGQVFAALPRLVDALPVLAAISLASYVVRYLRWRWLLERAGSHTTWSYGFAAYLAGFAFTATPGKVGELIRVRYLDRRDVPAHRTIAAFIVERAADLIVVLGLACLAIPRRDLLVLSLAFVVVLTGVLAVVATRPAWSTWIAAILRSWRWPRVARLVETIRDALTVSRRWLGVREAVVVVTLGIIAWTMTSGSFVWLLGRLDIPFAPRSAFAIYPLAMLAGAASMLPGGIGSTEAVIVALLLFGGVPFEGATLAAIGIRVASIWFATLCGVACALVLEWRTSPRSR